MKLWLFLVEPLIATMFVGLGIMAQPMSVSESLAIYPFMAIGFLLLSFGAACICDEVTRV